MTEVPDLSDTPTPDLCAMMMACAMFNDKSDRDFIKACRDELARRKPAPAKPQQGETRDR